MNRVVIISPYTGKTFSEIGENIIYAQACMRDSLNRGEAPFLSHLLYPQALNDKDPPQRKLGMKAGQTWIKIADYCVVYIDLGISKGMHEDIDYAHENNITVKERTLYG
jgi:hypothetical protein